MRSILLSICAMGMVISIAGVARAAIAHREFRRRMTVPAGAPQDLLIDLGERHAAREQWKMVAFEKDASSVGLWEADLPEDAVLVFGNEDDGCAPEILAAAQQVVAIPMYGINHSYPIAVSAGIAMAEWARRRYQQGRLVTPRQAPARNDADPSG